MATKMTGKKTTVAKKVTPVKKATAAKKVAPVKKTTAAKIDIIKLNAEIREIVAREQVLRDEIDKRSLLKSKEGKKYEQPDKYRF